MSAPRKEWSAEHLDALRAEGITIRADFASCAEAGEDYGRIARGAPDAVALPRCAGEVERIVRFANDEGLSLCARGRGLSQSGQSIVDHGVTLDLSRMDRIDAPDTGAETIGVEPGARLRDVVARTAREGLLPRVLPLNLDLTVGGVLSVGGIGATSHRFGPVAANVASVELVTGAGERAASTRGEPLFDAVAATLGRAGVITRATLELRRFRPRVRTFCLLYDALPIFVDDLMTAVRAEHVDYIEAFCAGAVQGLRSTPAGRRPFSQWFYGLHVGVEHELGAAPDAARALAGLHPYRVVNVDDDDTARFASRYDPRFEGMRRSGGWNEAHPWLEAMFTPESFVETAPRLLEMLPPALGDNHRVFPIATARAPRFFRTPDAPVVLGIGVFPVGVPRAGLEDALRAVGAAHRLVVEAGAKRYLAGWLGDSDEAAWRAHYGPEWDAFRRAKQELDPRGVLRSKLFDG